MSIKSSVPFSPFLVKALAAIAAFIFLVFLVMWLRRPPAPPVFDPVQAHSVWMQYIQTHVAPMTATTPVDDMTQAEHALLSMRISAQDKEVHLALVLALMQFARGDASALGRIHAITSNLK